jgi:hypothetical protein
MHTDLAECESCGNTGPVDMVNNMMLCALCQDRENNVIPAEPKPIVIETSVESEIKEVINDNSPTSLENEALNRMGSNSIKTTMDYFNARTTAIEELRKQIEADDSVSKENKHFELARIIRDHFKHMRRVLFEAMEVQLQCASEQRADQAYLNTLAAKLSREAKEELHLETPNYEPKKPPVSRTTSGPRMSKFDKQLESYAKALGIPVEQARRALEAGLKKQGYSCTCKETPGICKVHA